ncbi:MAG: tRNA pseudouridine(38-40) synthase TruA [Lachnospiraceae bacterium]|nr:tRNA pseudouridine(38-40) synthase TruA [Lachnospiraceae bacterium]
MRRIMLRVAYDGTDYVGWQYQQNGISIEEELNEALYVLTGEEISVIGASRTDAGVHAMGNVAVFDTASKIPADKFCLALNRYLPEDIVVQSSCEVAPDFNPRYAGSRKTYEYSICNAKIPDPLSRKYAFFVHYPLDVDLMNKAAAYLEGEHDFASFCSAGAQVKTTVRKVFSVECVAGPPMITIRITGGGFLYNMVRIIAGTLIQIGQGMYPPEKMKDILEACDRKQAGPTAPPQGLVLRKIEFEKDPEKDLPTHTEELSEGYTSFRSGTGAKEQYQDA